MLSSDQKAFRKWFWIPPLALIIGLLGAYWATETTTPTYKATCRLFASVASETTPSETYQGSLLAQERIVSYLELIKGDRVAQGAINRLGINMSAADLVQHIDATSELKSVLMDVSVTDSQADRAAQLANAVCSEFQGVAADTEAPSPVVNVKLVETANAPQQPISPKPAQNLAVGGLAGLLAGLGIVVALGRLRPTGKLDQESVPLPLVPTDESSTRETVAISTNGSDPTDESQRRHAKQGPAQ
jgi:polysaccharide biosynthesis transport protein